MFSRIRNKGKNLNNKKLLILSVSLLVSLIVLYFLLNFVYTKFRIKQNFEKDSCAIFEKTNSNAFSIDKIILYSSANATHNETNRNLWNLNIYQFTDIGIYLNNNSNEVLNSKNTIKTLYIDNINFSDTEKGTPSLFYQDVNNFGISELKDENKIEDRLEFNIIDSSEELDTSKPNLYNTCQTPIVLEFVNKDIKTNAIIPNTGEALNFDGSLLSNSNTSLNSISCNISFDINIINNLDEQYVYKVSFSIPLEDDDKNIYEGYIYKEINNTSNYNFLKIN